MKTFERYTPSSLTRYKGLGEMNGKDLFESTLDAENRTLIRYNIEDVKKEIETIQYLENNKSDLLKDIKVSRMDIIE
jgi:DNA gyrase subunit B